MSNELTARMRKALGILREEGDYESARLDSAESLVPRNRMCPGVGPQTIEALEEQGLIEKGELPGSKRAAYRITERGRKALETQPRPKKRSKRSKIEPLSPRIPTMKFRLGD